MQTSCASLWHHPKGGASIRQGPLHLTPLFSSFTHSTPLLSRRVQIIPPKFSEKNISSLSQTPTGLHRLTFTPQPTPSRPSAPHPSPFSLNPLFLPTFFSSLHPSSLRSPATQIPPFTSDLPPSEPPTALRLRSQFYFFIFSLPFFSPSANNFINFFYNYRKVSPDSTQAQN